jgi:hypothetical protein
MLPPDCWAATAWSAPRSVSIGLPAVSAVTASSTEPSHSTIITPSNTLPCLRSFTMRP